MAKKVKNPCYITYKGEKYSYPDWVEFLYGGGLANMVKSGEVSVKGGMKGLKPIGQIKRGNPALANVEATAKALEGVDLNELANNSNNSFFRGTHENPSSDFANKDIVKFSEGDTSYYSSMQGFGKFFSKSKDIAESYIDFRLRGDDTGTMVYAYINPKKSFKVKSVIELINKSLEYWRSISDSEVTQTEKNIEFKDFLVKNGYDSIQYKEGPRNSPNNRKFAKTVIVPLDKNITTIIGTQEFGSRNRGAISDIKYNYKSISEAYHKAKEDGSNPELVKAVEELLGGKESVPRFNLGENRNEDVALAADVIKGMLDENPDMTYDEIFEAAKEGLGEEYPDLTELIRDAYVEAANQGAGDFVKPIEERMNKGFLKIGTEFYSPEALRAKAKELMGMGDVRYNMTINGKDVEVKRVGADVVNGFYSPLEKIISESKQDKMPIKQWMDKFVKGEEAKWTGLVDWLSQQTGSISKQDILNYLKDNRIEIVEVVKGGEAIMSKESAKKVFKDNGYDVITDRNGDTYVEKDGEIFDYDDMSELEKSAFDILTTNNLDRANTSNDTVYGNRPDLQLTGEKENYKEVLVTLPREKITDLPEGFKIKKTKRGYEGEFPDGSFTEEKATEQEVRDWAIKWYNSNYREAKEATSKFKSSHFEEPNILVHLRMNTRTDAKGNKVLFLEEVQSDWGQEGKKKGFKQDFDKNKVSIEWTPEYGTNVKGEKYPLKNSFTILYDGNPISGKIGGYYETDQDALNYAIKDAEKDFEQRKETKVPTAPFVMDTNAWTKLGLKVALKEAVAQGVDRIAWTTGEQQNDRYDLSKQVDEIIYTKNNDNTFDLYATKNGQTVSQNFNKTIKEIESIAGKDIADKILNEEGVDVKGTTNKSLKGDNLKVGGKGMIAFYGSIEEGKEGIVGGVAKALVKELTGKPTEIVKIKIGVGKNYLSEEQVKIVQQKENQSLYDVIDNSGKKIGTFDKYIDAVNAQRDAIKENTATQASIEITPELKEAVNRGIPMFSLLGNDAQIIGFAHGDKVYLNRDKMTPKTQFEEAGHIWINWAKQNRADLYNEGLKKVEGSKYLDEVEKDKNYIQAAKDSGLKQGTKEWKEYMKEEALSKAIADEGTKFVSEARKKGFKEWLNNFWKAIAEQFGIRDMAYDDVKNLTLEQFARMVAADVFNEATDSQKRAEAQAPKKSDKTKLSEHYQKIKDFFADAKKVEAKYKPVADKMSSSDAEYQPITHKETRAAAIEYLQSVDSIEDAIAYAGKKEIDKDSPTLQNAVAFMLYGQIVDQAEDAMNKGDVEVSNDLYDKLIELMDNVSARGSYAGQHVDSYRLFTESGIFSSPESYIHFMKNVYDKMNKGAKNKSSNKSKASNIKKATNSSKNKAKEKVSSIVDESESKVKPKKFKLTDKEQTEYDDLKRDIKSRYGSLFFDATTLPALLTDKKFIKYSLYSLKQTGYDIANFTNKLVEDFGEGVRKYANKIYENALEQSELADFNKFIESEEAKIAKAEKEMNMSDTEREIAKADRKRKREENAAKKEASNKAILESDFNKDADLQRYADMKGVVITNENKEKLRDFAKMAQVRLKSISDAKAADLLKKQNEKTVEGKVKDALKQRGLAIKDIANKRIDGQIKTLQEVKNQLISEAGLTDAEAEDYANKIDATYREMKNKYLVGTVERNKKKHNNIQVKSVAKAYAGTKISLDEFKDKIKKETSLTDADISNMAKFIANLHNDVVKGGIMSDEFLQDLTPFERLEQLDAEGLLTDGAIMDIFATNFGINSLTPQNIASITKAINSANQTNNPIARQTIINNMIAQINKNKNVSFTDYFKSTWFASVLSGTGTLDLNFAWGLGTWENFFGSTLISSMGEALGQATKGDMKGAAAVFKNLLKMYQAFFVEQVQKDASISENAKEAVYSFFIKNQLYTMTQGSDLFNEQLKELLYSREKEVDFGRIDLPKALSFIRHLNKPVKGVPRLLQSVDFFFYAPMKNAMTVAFIFSDEYNKLDKEIEVRNGSFTYLGQQYTFANDKEAQKAKQELIRKEAEKKVDEYLYKTEDEMEDAFNKAKADRLLADIVIQDVNGKFVVKDMDKVKGTFDTMQEAENFADEIASKGVRIQKYIDFYKTENVDAVTLAKARNFASERTLNSSVKGSFGLLYDKGLLRFKKSLARGMLRAKEGAKESFREGEYGKSAAKMTANYALLTLDLSTSFLRVGLNGVREATNFFPPIGYLRAFRGGGIMSKHNLELWDNKQRNILLGQATIGAIAASMLILRGLGVDDDDDDETKKSIMEWNERHPDSQIPLSMSILVTPYDGMVIGDMTILDKNLQDFLKERGADNFTVYDAKSGTFKSYINNPAMSWSYAMAGTYNVYNMYINNNSMLSGKSKIETKNDVIKMTGKVILSGLKIALAQSSARGISTDLKIAEKVLNGDLEEAINAASDIITAPAEALRPKIINGFYSYFNPDKEEFVSIKKHGLSSYLYSKMPLYINLMNDHHYAYNTFGHKVLFVTGEKQGFFAPIIKSKYAKNEEYINDMNMMDYLLSKGYDKAHDINFNSDRMNFYDKDGNVDYISNYPKYQESVSVRAGNLFYDKLTNNKSSLDKLSTTPKTEVEYDDITHEKVNAKSSEFTTQVSKYWKEAVNEAYKEFAEKHLYISNKKLYLKSE